MPTHNIDLTDHDDQFVEALVGAGRYKDASEVMHAGLRLLEQAAKADEEKLTTLRALAAEGFEALDRGEGTKLEGERQIAGFIRGIGERAARQSTDPLGDQ